MRLFDELSPFLKQVVEILVREGGMILSDGEHTFFEDGTVEKNPCDDEFDGLVMIGAGAFDDRLVEFDDYVEHYGWCYNSHGTTMVFRHSKEDFLEKARQLVKRLHEKDYKPWWSTDTDPKDERRLGAGALWSDIFESGKPVDQATW
jgi:hypothetical protein